MISQAARKSQKPQLPQLSSSVRVSPDLLSLTKVKQYTVICTSHTGLLIGAGDEVQFLRHLGADP